MSPRTMAGGASSRRSSTSMAWNSVAETCRACPCSIYASVCLCASVCQFVPGSPRQHVSVSASAAACLWLHVCDATVSVSATASLSLLGIPSMPSSSSASASVPVLSKRARAC
eukprot:2839264-Rhodomonas_salina.2